MVHFTGLFFAVPDLYGFNIEERGTPDVSGGVNRAGGMALKKLLFAIYHLLFVCWWAFLRKIFQFEWGDFGRGWSRRIDIILLLFASIYYSPLPPFFLSRMSNQC